MSLIGLIIGISLYPAETLKRETFMKGWAIGFIMFWFLGFIIGLACS